MDVTWESSDPRLSGEVASAGNRQMKRDGSGVVAETFAVVNDDGRWLGQSIGLTVAPPAPDLVIRNGLLPTGPGAEGFVQLRGEGEYEGLSALVDLDSTQQPPVISAVIFSGEMPPAPELWMAEEHGAR